MPIPLLKLMLSFLNPLVGLLVLFTSTPYRDFFITKLRPLPSSPTSSATPSPLSLPITSPNPSLVPSFSPSPNSAPSLTPSPSPNLVEIPTPTSSLTHSLTITNPNTSQTLVENQSVTITWNSTKDFNRLDLFFVDSNGFSRGIASNVPDTGSYSWTATRLDLTDTLYKIGIVGLVNNVLTTQDKSDDFYTYAPPSPTPTPSSSKCNTPISFTQTNSPAETVIAVEGAWYLSVKASPNYNSVDFDTSQKIVYLHFTTVNSGTIYIYEASYAGAPLCQQHNWNR